MKCEICEQEIKNSEYKLLARLVVVCYDCLGTLSNLGIIEHIKHNEEDNDEDEDEGT